jgi:multiple sugar transport system permease protein
MLMSTLTEKKGRKKKRNWAPYLLILPSLIYLALFFAWPMVQGLVLAVREDNALLTLRAEPQRGGGAVAQLSRGAQVTILEREANFVPPEDLNLTNLITEIWYQVQAETTEGEEIEGWIPERRVRVREQDDSGVAISGTIRPILGASAAPLTSVHAEADDDSEVLGRLEAQAPVSIHDQVTLEVWYLVQGMFNDETVEGWTQSRFVRLLGDQTIGRVEQGDTNQFTTNYIQRMVNDRFFMPALRTTLLLIIMIIPVQFILSIIMALVIQANLKGSGIFLYIFAIALGVSDLAVGIVWYSVFTHFGYLNSILQTLGLIDAPITYLSANSRHWIIIAIWLAEVWRSTAIVMVIVVAGLQAISREVLEASEVFGANLWQRLRYVILPLLRPSLQVALILRTILAFQVFAVVIVLSGGDIVTVLANETYRQYYDLRNFNVAAAYASFILLLSLVSAFFYLQAVRTQEEAVA